MTPEDIPVVTGHMKRTVCAYCGRPFSEHPAPVDGAAALVLSPSGMAHPTCLAQVVYPPPPVGTMVDDPPRTPYTARLPQP